MPLLNHLDFTRDALALSYRASASPQEMSIIVETGGAAGYPVSPTLIRDVMASINAGAAGGAEFHPTAGSCEILDDCRTPLGPRYAWTLRVAGVAPLFMRILVEKLRAVGWDEPVTSMRIAGSLPPDESALSVREPRVRAWLDDPGAYPAAWPETPFALLRRPAAGASLRAVPASPITPAVSGALESLCVGWLNAVSEYVDTDGDYVPVEFDAKYLPAFGRTRTEFRAAYQRFRHTRVPARAALVNMLVRFHHAVAPLIEVEIGL
ncbi:hypothetical protein [Sorangium sp. So ce388]|uniref:hypothetical protein n=1 Tax=Sorangium sp. So ce388 TaxID=3133309 RepID=UPI003F5C41DC